MAVSSSVADLSSIVSRITATKGVSTLPAGFAITPPPYTEVYGTTAHGAFRRSFDALPQDVRSIVYKNRGGMRVSQTRVGMDLIIRADPRMQAFIKRLPRAPREVRKVVKKTLRTAAREEFLPVLRRNIPHSGRGKVVTRVARGTKIDRKVRGRSQVYGRKKHIRQTARIARVEAERIVITVGNADLWYGAALHAKQPFFPPTIAEAFPKLNARIERDMYNLLEWLGDGRRRIG